MRKNLWEKACILYTFLETARWVDKGLICQYFCVNMCVYDKQIVQKHFVICPNRRPRCHLLSEKKINYSIAYREITEWHSISNYSHLQSLKVVLAVWDMCCLWNCEEEWNVDLTKIMNKILQKDQQLNRATCVYGGGRVESLLRVRKVKTIPRLLLLYVPVVFLWQ